MAGERRTHTRAGEAARTPAADLVGLLEGRHGLKAEESTEPGRVVVRGGNGTVTIVLVGGRWFRQHTSLDGRKALVPLAPVGRELSVARAVATEFIEARAVE